MSSNISEATSPGSTRPSSVGDAANGSIIDIRTQQSGYSLAEDMKASLKSCDKDVRQFPTLLLWNEEGLKAFDAVTNLDVYYPTATELELLKRNSDQIAEAMEPGTMLIELGSGNPRKIKVLLEAFENHGKALDYFCLDVDHAELAKGVGRILEGKFKHVSVRGLLGTYDDALAWLKRQNSEGSNSPVCVASFGSTIGSFSRSDAAKFLGEFADAISDREVSTENRRRSETEVTMMIAVDGCKDGEKVFNAYNDVNGLNKQFILNGLNQANSVLETEAFSLSDWTVVGEWDAETGSHNQFYIPLKDVIIQGTPFKKGQRVLAVQSHKYDRNDQQELWTGAGLEPVRQWSSDDGSYSINLLSPTRRASLAAGA